MIQAKINTGLGCFVFFSLLSFNPDLFTHLFLHAAKQNACREGTEQSLGQAAE